MQAIVAGGGGATDYRGSRVKATCQAGSVTLSWDDTLDVDGNHNAAAGALAAKLGWDRNCYGTMHSGGMPDGNGNVYVFVK